MNTDSVNSEMTKYKLKVLGRLYETIACFGLDIQVRSGSELPEQLSFVPFIRSGRVANQQLVH